MEQEKQFNYNTRVLICNQLTDIESVKGRNGIPLFTEWSQIRDDSEDNSRGDIARACRIRGD
jgi:hypothetical protein